LKEEMLEEMSKVDSFPEPPFVVGVDVGGTKILSGLVDAKGHIHGRAQRKTVVGNPAQILQIIVDTVVESGEDAKVRSKDIIAVGLGIPGLVDSEAGLAIRAANFSWQNLPIKAELEAILGKKCAIENDVNTAALGELHFGAGRNLSNLIYLNIGTGIAAGIILDRKLYHGSRGMAGEIGHAVIDPSGPLCKCGARGCLEAFASGPAIAYRASEKISLQQGENHEPKGEEQELTAEEVFHRAERGDRIALETLSEVSGYLALAVRLMIMSYDPELIVFGGGVSLAGKTLLELIRSHLERQAAESWVFKGMYGPDLIQPSSLGIDVGILGAATLVASGW
jgi:glucokinase